MAHDRIIGLYQEHAEAWDAMRSRSISPPEIPHIESFIAALAGGAAVLDIGCGGGDPIARRLVEAGLRVTGVDASPGLIALCRKRFPEADWHVADMRRLDLPRRFDGLIAWWSTFHLPPDDQRAMFPIFAAHAAPGAVLMFTSGSGEGERIGQWQGEPLYHASLSQEEYRTLLAAHRFEVLRFSDGEPVASGPTVWVARYRA